MCCLYFVALITLNKSILIRMEVFFYNLNQLKFLQHSFAMRYPSNHSWVYVHVEHTPRDDVHYLSSSSKFTNIIIIIIIIIKHESTRSAATETCYGCGDNKSVYLTYFGGSRLLYLKFHLCIISSVI